jgi:hypothetical protein
VQTVEHPQVQLAILFLGGILVAGAMLWSLEASWHMNSVTTTASIGPRVYKTQAAMIRTFQSIGSLQGIRVGAIQLMYGLISFLLKQYSLDFFGWSTSFPARKNIAPMNLPAFQEGLKSRTGDPV